MFLREFIEECKTRKQKKDVFGYGDGKGTGGSS